MPFSIPRRRLLAGALAALPLALALPGCTSKAGPLPFEGNDITGSHLGRDLDMIDTTGQRRTLADFRGKVLLVFFGYTQCPDVCPTAMAQAAQAMQLLGDQAGDVRVIMVSVLGGLLGILMMIPLRRALIVQRDLGSALAGATEIALAFANAMPDERDGSNQTDQATGRHGPGTNVENVITADGARRHVTDQRAPGLQGSRQIVTEELD